jgi:nucleoside-triphosphatase THEP1
MDIEKYKKLREEIRNKSFEKKYTTVDWILYYASFFGNIASIFFAFFLWFPSLLKTITLHVADNSITYAVAVGVTIVLLSIVEFLKRGIVGIFSSEFIEGGSKFSNKSVISLAFFSIAILALSFYFSINGAIEFSKTSGKINVEIEANTKTLIDSLTKINEKDKLPIVEELASLRASNKDLRLKRDDTPLDQRRVRQEYNKLIDDNEKLIEKNTSKLNEVDISFKRKLDGIKAENLINKTKIEDSDKGNVLLFLIVSTFIEVMIVIGVYFRQLYIHKAFYESEQKLEPLVRKREKYETLLKLVYKNGEVRQDDTIISLKKLTEIVKNKGAHFTPKHVSDFYLEMGHLGAFKVVANKRYAMVSYDEAKKLLESLENL